MAAKVNFAIAMIAVTVCRSRGFLLDTDCPVSTPCFCGSDNVDCYYKGLTTVPVFRTTSARMARTTAVYLNTNNISVIPPNAFSNLATLGDIMLYLQHNHLNDNSFPVGAFNGVSGVLSYLDLSNNYLTTLPTEVAELTYLHTLVIQDNPLAVVDTHAMTRISYSLKHLYISLPYVTAWPVAFYNLTGLEFLYLYDYRHDIPGDAFKSFLSSLQILKVHNAENADLPHLACGLERLQELIVSGVTRYKEVDMPCRRPLTAVKTLLFKNTTIENFPYVFNLFPNADSLFITTSKINFVDICELPPNVTLEAFGLSDSRLTSVPEIINDFQSLSLCNLNENKITSLNRHSIKNLPNLSVLRLRYNPLVFIAKCAFVNLPKLATIDLSQTHLKTIPQALDLLPGLLKVEMEDDPVSCDCHLHWTNKWARRTSVSFDWYCPNIINTYTRINEFLNTTIPPCA